MKTVSSAQELCDEQGNLVTTSQENLKWLVLNQELEHTEKQVIVIQKHHDRETVEKQMEFVVETER